MITGREKDSKSTECQSQTTFKKNRFVILQVMSTKTKIFFCLPLKLRLTISLVEKFCLIQVTTSFRNHSRGTSSGISILAISSRVTKLQQRSVSRTTKGWTTVDWTQEVSVRKRRIKLQPKSITTMTEMSTLKLTISMEIGSTFKKCHPSQ